MYRHRLHARRFASTAVAVVLLALLSGCGGGGGQEPQPPKRTCSPAPPYGKGNWPPAPCWRPYHDQSPFNQPVGQVLREYPNSVASIQRLLADPMKHPANLVANVDGHSGEPTYYSRATDPEYTLRCTMQVWAQIEGPCPIEGQKIRIPAGAFVEGNRPAAETNNDPGYQGQPDAHLTVVDQDTGWEYDLWQVHRSPIEPSGGGELRFSWGGRTRIDGDGISEGHATAAHFGNLAGRIRAEELAAGKIEHALAVVIPCDNGEPIYPARGKGRRCADPTHALPMGARLQLNLPAGRIEELRSKNVPEWKLTILTALRDYGGYVNDTGSDNSWFGFEQESGDQYTVVGDVDPWLAFAKKHENTGGWFYKKAGQEPTYPAEHYVGIMRKDADGIDWRDQVWRHLRVLFPDYPNQVQIRPTDPYPPLASLVGEPGQGALEAEVTDATPTPPERAFNNPQQVISLLAQGRDGESGIKAIEIWVETTTWSRPPGSNKEVQHGPGLVGGPAADNTDPASRGPGETVASNRLTAYQVKFADITPGMVRARVRVWATARNYRGQAAETQRIVYTWAAP